jgi:hypothetical protein
MNQRGMARQKPTSSATLQIRLQRGRFLSTHETWKAHIFSNLDASKPSRPLWPSPRKRQPPKPDGAIGLITGLPYPSKSQTKTSWPTCFSAQCGTPQKCMSTSSVFGATNAGASTVIGTGFASSCWLDPWTPAPPSSAEALAGFVRGRARTKPTPASPLSSRAWRSRKAKIVLILGCQPRTLLEAIAARLASNRVPTTLICMDSRMHCLRRAREHLGIQPPHLSVVFVLGGHKSIPIRQQSVDRFLCVRDTGKRYTVDEPLRHAPSLLKAQGIFVGLDADLSRKPTRDHTIHRELTTYFEESHLWRNGRRCIVCGREPIGAPVDLGLFKAQ